MGCQLQVRKAGTFRKITFTQASSSSKLLLHNLNSHGQARVSHIIKVKSSYLLFMYIFSVEMMTWRDKNFDVCSYFVSKKSNKFVVRNLKKKQKKKKKKKKKKVPAFKKKKKKKKKKK